MRPKSVGRLAALVPTALLLCGMTSAGSAQAQQEPVEGPISYSIEFSNPQEKDDNDLPEPYGKVSVTSPSGQETALWEHPDRDLNTPTLPRYPSVGLAEHRFVPHSIRGVCAEVGEDDTGINQDDRLADACAPYTGPGVYTLPGQDGSVTVTVYEVG